MKLYRVLLLSVLIGMPSTAAFADPPSNMQVFTSSGSFTVPSGITKIEVELCGGGRGGSGVVGTNTGAAGHGGGFGKGVFTATAGSTHAVTVGAGGAGGGTAGGAAGGTSSFGTLISATGGSSSGGGTSTAPLNMTGFSGGSSHINASGQGPSYTLGGPCGNGSSRGKGGNGTKSTTGGAGTAGYVVVRW